MSSLFSLFSLYTLLRIIKLTFETSLSLINRSYYRDPSRQTSACSQLGITPEHMRTTLAYSEAKMRHALTSEWISVAATLAFIATGGLGWVESMALQVSTNPIIAGLVFFAIIAVLSMLISLPFEYEYTFGIEERFGFNKQTLRGFISDKIKGALLGSILGGALLAMILYVMGTFTTWWLYAWIAMTLFSLLANWLYPVLLAPLFNKFTPLEDGPLRSEIFALAQRVDFNAADIFLMDASKRSTHGNAYFAGMFGKKRIVLFDTLLKDLSPREIVATLAHELGHFKLNHVRWMVLRSVLTTGIIFYLFSLLQNFTPAYEAFGFTTPTAYAGLLLFSMWFGLLDLFTQPFSSWLSRRNEFSADRFAKDLGFKDELVAALKKLQESNHTMPISHPVFSGFYHSHPPVLERMAVLLKEPTVP